MLRYGHTDTHTPTIIFEHTNIPILVNQDQQRNCLLLSLIQSLNLEKWFHCYLNSFSVCTMHCFGVNEVLRCSTVYLYWNSLCFSLWNYLCSYGRITKSFSVKVGDCGDCQTIFKKEIFDKKGRIKIRTPGENVLESHKN